MTTEVTDLDLRRNTIRCSWGDEVFTISKTIGRETQVIALTQDEEDYLYEQLRIKRTPFDGAS